MCYLDDIKSLEQQVDENLKDRPSDDVTIEPHLVALIQRYHKAAADYNRYIAQRFGLSLYVLKYTDVGQHNDWCSKLYNEQNKRDPKKHSKWIGRLRRPGC